ncbi:hypothetical protein K1719_015335 [Acacia pycnantha]|nr:hypothetical protein K1719_015335 [Acacia pycnantha]
MAAPAEEKVNVLMVSMAFQGHLNPMLKLANLLISKDLHVTLATTHTNRSNPISSHNNSQIKIQFFSDGLSPDFDRVNYFDVFFDSLKTNGPKNLSTLISNSSHQFSCLIINPFMPWAINVANELGIPCAILWIQASSVFSIYYRYYKNVNFFPNLEDPNEIVHLPGLPTLEVRDLPTFMLPSNSGSFKNLLQDLFQSLDKVQWVLATSFDDIEEEIVKSMNCLIMIRSIGPLVSPFLLGQKEADDLNVNLWKSEESCIKWLDEKPDCSVIYISFGSIIVLTQKQMDNIAMALRNTKKSFLWVVKPARKDCEEDDSANLLPSEFLEEATTKERGLVVSWCPQEKVLMHRSVGCFMTHCGWNSTVETVVAGVPVIAYPKWSDQPTNAKLCESFFGNGVKVKFEEDANVSAAELERCIRKVMEDPEGEKMKKKALEMKVAARKALEEGGSSHNNVNHFMAELVHANNGQKRG